MLWSQRYANTGCDATFTGVGILPKDVIVSGISSAPVTFGATTFHQGGFLLDLEGR